MIDSGKMPKAPREFIICVNGEFLPDSQAFISVLDHGLLYGDGCFEAWCGKNGFIYELDARLKRMRESLFALKITPVESMEKIRADIIETVRRNALIDFYIKLVITRGSSPHPVMDPRKCDRPNVITYVRPTQYEVSDDKKSHGIKLKVLSKKRVTHECLSPQIKSLNYLNLIMGKYECWECGFDEAVMLDQQGYLTESTGFNICFIKDNVLYTPSHGVLVGITRNGVLDMAREAELDVQTGFYTTHDLIIADEVFLTNTVSGITSVTNVDGFIIGNGKPGRYTNRFAETYLNWLTNGVRGTQCFPEAWV